MSTYFNIHFVRYEGEDPYIHCTLIERGDDMLQFITNLHSQIYAYLDFDDYFSQFKKIYFKIIQFHCYHFLFLFPQVPLSLSLPERPSDF